MHADGGICGEQAEGAQLHPRDSRRWDAKDGGRLFNSTPPGHFRHTWKRSGQEDPHDLWTFGRSTSKNGQFGVPSRSANLKSRRLINVYFDLRAMAGAMNHLR